jgi:hypothetical protein
MATMGTEPHPAEGAAAAADHTHSGAEQEVRTKAIDHFPAVCLCGAPRCRGSVTGWKDLTAPQTEGHGDLVAPYLLAMDNDIRLAHSGTASTG